MKLGEVEIEIKVDITKFSNVLKRLKINLMIIRFDEMFPGMRFIPKYFKKLIMIACNYKGESWMKSL